MKYLLIATLLVLCGSLTLQTDNEFLSLSETNEFVGSPATCATDLNNDMKYAFRALGHLMDPQMFGDDIKNLFDSLSATTKDCFSSSKCAKAFAVAVGYTAKALFESSRGEHDLATETFNKEVIPAVKNLYPSCTS